MRPAMLALNRARAQWVAARVRARRNYPERAARELTSCPLVVRLQVVTEAVQSEARQMRRARVP